MMFMIIFPLLMAVASAQFFPVPWYGPSSSFDEDYAASLGNAPVGLYDKKHYGGPNGPYGSNTGNTEVAGASLGGAKVGLYGKDHQQGPVGYPIPYSYRPPVGPYVRPPVLGYRLPY